MAVVAECCGATGSREGAIGAAFCAAAAAAVSLAGLVVLEPVFFLFSALDVMFSISAA